MSMISPYLIVLWKKENKYSMVKRDAIFDPVLKQKVDKDLWKMSLSVRWRNNKPFEAEVVDTGSLAEMTVELKRLETEAAEGPELSSTLCVASSSKVSGLSKNVKVKLDKDRSQLKRKLEPKKLSVKQVKANNQAAQITRVLGLYNFQDDDDEHEKNSKSSSPNPVNEGESEEEEDGKQKTSGIDGGETSSDDSGSNDSSDDDEDEFEKENCFSSPVKSQSQKIFTARRLENKNSIGNLNQNGKGGGAAEKNKQNVFSQNKTALISSSGGGGVVMKIQSQGTQGNGLKSVAEKTTTTTNKNGERNKMSIIGNERSGKNPGVRTGTRVKIGAGGKTNGISKENHIWERRRTRSGKGNSVESEVVLENEESNRNVNQEGEGSGLLNVGGENQDQSRDRQDDENENVEDQENIENGLDDLQDDLEGGLDDPVEIREPPTINEYRQLLKRLEENKILLAKYRNRNTALQAKVEKLEADRGPGMQDLGHGVRVRVTDIETIKSLSPSASIFARNLLRFLFKEEELVNKSLFGRKTGGNPDPSPELEPNRRNAVIMATLERYGTKDDRGSVIKGDPLLSVIHGSLGDMLREIKKKAERQQRQENIENVD